ncbi:YicC/YloC family endoribonuclease [Sporolactobacillus vineae]|uniref:YicC/YloC family endoribonuclease n=1 Tax=Sporolactobacillus vineae TaxID=444463 RepID=UPI00028A1D96|nr:YicC/YloC family endoribonuclease [Sporolactobacillus vineae]
MINSMTGYGSAVISDNDATARAELKSVNHRFFDLSMNLPRPFLYLENRIRNEIHSFFQRGSLTLYLTLDGGAAAEPKLNTDWALADQYLQAAKDLEKRSGTSGWDLSAVLTLPGIFTVREPDTQTAKQAEAIVLKAVRQACRQMQEMRRNEGEQLRTDLIAKADFIANEVGALEAYAPEVHRHYARRLREHITEFLADSHELDEDRLMNEIAVFTDKSAIDEELTRMKSHLAQFRLFLSNSSESVPVGRKLDFLTQEMNREMNTIGSKGNDAEISRKVVLLKSEIEKLREQVQNIE